MANFHRVIRLSLYFLVGLLIGSVSVLARAETITATSQAAGSVTAPVIGKYWKVSGTGTPNWTTFEAACSGIRAAAGQSACSFGDSPKAINTSSFVTQNAGSCNYQSGSVCYSASGVSYNQSCPSGYGAVSGVCKNISPIYTCPDGQNWTLSGSTCTRPDCGPNEERGSDGVCKPVTCPYGTASDGTCLSQCEPGFSHILGGKSCVSETCPDGSKRASDGLCRGNACTSINNNQFSSKPPTLDSYETSVCTDQGCVQSAWKYSGGSATRLVNGECTPGVPLDNPDCRPGFVKQTVGATSKCYPASGTCASSGQCSGTVNGVTVCVPCDPGTKTTTGGSSSDTKTGTDAAGNSTGSETKNVETKTEVEAGSGSDGSGDKVTTTKTTTNADGSKTTETTTQDKKTFCEENPNSSICANGAFSGSCGSEPSCTGDAVQCAQARAAWKLQCDLSTEPTDAAYTLGKSLAAGGSDPLGNPLDPTKITSVDVGQIVSDAAGQRTLTASCIASPSFSVMGKTYTFDTTNFCRFAEIVGYLMVAASSIIAIRMVTSGV